ncbi:3D domain-containing protein [Clostridium sp. WILCCON 0269]|uniref:3D domain-containing protein n=1 Tax=Candidatus Clostridium eludens TaxID=3381663 RepID=A0ABW8SJA2_9CLOT
MNKRTLYVIMTLALVIITCGSVLAAPNSTSDELTQTQNNKKELQSKVNSLNEQIDGVIKNIEDNKKAMNKIAGDIKKTQVKLENAKNNSKIQDNLFKSRIKAMYINGTDAYLEVLLSSESFSDFLSRMDTITKVMQFDKGIIAKLKKDEETIENQKQALNYENNKLQTLRKTNEITLSKLNDNIQQQKELLAKAAEKEQQLKEQQLIESAALYRQVSLAYNNSSNLDGQTLSRGGRPVSFSQVLSVSATAYCDQGITASGAVTVRNPNSYSTIAVDPRVIPMGSRVYVDGYGYAIAQDIGGAIIGNRIDVFFPSEGEAQNWGRRAINVYILN